MTKEITVAAAAVALGLSRQRVAKICKARNLGRLVTPRLRLLSRADLANLENRNPSGNPNFGKTK